jgi:hypothetical protein
MTASWPPRTNEDGHPCPPWCIAQHSELRPVHLGTAAGIDAPRILARPVHAGSTDDEPEIVVSGGAYPAGLDLFVAARPAEQLAGLIDMLAVATPGQHGQLAAAIRTAAAIAEAEQR